MHRSGCPARRLCGGARCSMTSGRRRGGTGCSGSGMGASRAGGGGPPARAVGAASSRASGLGLPVEDAVVLHNSNRIAVRLTPCDVLARVAPISYQTAGEDLELKVARRLAEIGSPVGEPEPRVEPVVYA